MSAINSVSTSRPPTATGGFDALTSQDFLKVMLTELSKQDPLSPSDTKEILGQISTIRSIESNLALQRDLDSLVTQNQTSAAGTLIGKYVSGLSDAGDRVESLVGSVSVTRDGPILNLLNGRRVPMKNVEEILDPALLQQLGGGGGAGATGGAQG